MTKLTGSALFNEASGYSIGTACLHHHDGGITETFARNAGTSITSDPSADMPAAKKTFEAGPGGMA